MGHMGNPAAVTPFLDRFADGEAVSFGGAGWAVSPVCLLAEDEGPVGG